VSKYNSKIKLSDSDILKLSKGEALHRTVKFAGDVLELWIVRNHKKDVTKDYDGFMSWVKKNRGDVALMPMQAEVAMMYFDRGKFMTSPPGWGKSYLKKLLKEYLNS